MDGILGTHKVVESVNSALKGAFVDLNRGLFRVFGRTKMTVLLAFTVAAFNLDPIRSFRAKFASQAAKPIARARRRRVTWGDLVDTSPTIDSGQQDHPPD